MSIARYHQIFPTLWTEAKRMRWGTNATLLGAYLLTNKHRLSEGLFYLPLMYIQHDLGLSARDARRALDTLIERRFVAFDPDAEVVFLCRALRFHRPEGAKQVAGAVRRLEGVPTTVLRGRFLAAADELAPDLAAALRSVAGWAAVDTPPGTHPPHRPASGSPSEGVSAAGVSPPDGDSPLTQLNSTSTPTQTQTQPLADLSRKAAQRAREARVWQHYLAVHRSGPNHRTTMDDFDETQRRVVRRALAARPIETVLAAIDGLALSDLHNARGRFAGGSKYLDLRYALRGKPREGESDAQRIDRFADLARQRAATTANEGDPARFSDPEEEIA